MDTSCTIYKTADFIGKRWTLLILLELYKGGNCRYSDIKRNVPNITPKILSSRLKELEQQGLVKKRVDDSSIPVACYYSLNDSGREFVGIIQDMKSWALKWKFNSKVCDSIDCKNCKL